MSAINLTMPPDVHRHVLDYQGKQKVNKGTSHYTLTQAIVAMLREHKIYSDENSKTEKDPLLNESEKS